MIQLYLRSVSDILSTPPLDDLLVRFLFIEHLLPERQQPLLVCLHLNLLLLLPLLQFCLCLKIHLLPRYPGILGIPLCWLLLISSILFGDDIIIVELDCLPIVLPHVEVHARLDLEYEVSPVATEHGGAETVTLRIQI